MKTISRIIIILLAATLIGGLFYSVVSAGSSSTSQTSISEGPTGDFPQPDDDREEGGISFPVESIKSLALISIACAAYLNVAKRKPGKKLPLKIAA